MKKDYKVIHKPDWIKKLVRNEKQRLRYWIKKANGNEAEARKQMAIKDSKFQAWLDEDAFENELIATGIKSA